METRLDDLDLLAIQIDGIHMDEDMLLVAAIGVDANGDKHPLGLVEGATENATTVQALIDNLIERGLDPTVRRLFIIEAQRRCPRRSAAPLDAMRRSSVARFTRRATFWSGCPNRCTLRCGASCGKPGKWTTPKGRNPHSQSRPPSRTGLERRFCFDPGRDQRDAHRYQARPPLRTAPLARLHQHHRECHGHGAQSLPQRQYWRSPSMALRGPPPPCTKRSRASVD